MIIKKTSLSFLFIFIVCFFSVACENQSTPANEISLLNETYWNVIWEGYGNVTFSDGIILEPAVSTSADETHAALVLYQPWLDDPVSDFTVTITYTLDEQLRIGTPNPWETFWLFFNTTYDADENDITTNYFILKPNGVELGIAYPDSVQEFLYTDDEPTLNEGESATVTVIKSGQQLNVTINGTLAFTYDGDTEEIPLLNTPGTLGLYTEDARVVIHAVEFEAR